MTEYINKQALLAEYDCVHVGPPGGARKLIEEAPTADVAPVVHGRWVDGECGTFCTNCNRVFDEEFEIRRDVCKKLLRCPNCGAHMKDGE